MELATPHHPDRACRLTRPARLIGAHHQLGGKIEKSSLWPRWSSLPAVRRDDSCLERNRAPRGPQRMLTLEILLGLGKLLDIFRGVLEGDELAAAGQGNGIVEGARPGHL